jgi:dTDP-L-rhamnose 4-epimerase
LRDKLNVDVEPQVVNKFRAGDIRHCFADISKSERLLGYHPTVSFEDGMDELIEWIRQQEAVDQVDRARGRTRTARSYVLKLMNQFRTCLLSS